MARGRRREIGALDTWSALRVHGRQIVRKGADSFREHDLLSYASALSFQVLFALVPLALTGLATLGFLDLAEVWSERLAPRVREEVRSDAWSVIDRIVQDILGEKRTLWLTFGAAFSLWQVSGAVRTTMTPLNRVYGIEERRPWWGRVGVSIALAFAIVPLVFAAVATTQLAPRLARSLDGGRALEVVLFVARWPAAAALLACAVWLLLRYAPARPQPFAWAGLGSAFVVVAWLVASAAFGVYASAIADYGSAFGSLASVIVLMTYLYISSIALLFGVELDARLRDQAQRN